jgi:glucoamylase
MWGQMKDKINKTLAASRQVIRDCTLENGALVAANPTKKYYSNQVKHYFYVWPRDAAFTCMAANLIGICDIQENFFDWIRDRAEDIDADGHVCKTTGLLYEKYYVNGLQALHRYQPDQGGALLFAMADHFKKHPENKNKYLDLGKELADGICNAWDGEHFRAITNDLWEERHTFPDLKDNFSYSLAACSGGLRAIHEILPNARYQEVAGQMKHLVIASAEETGFFFRSFGILNDKNVDASMIGLIWPFEIISPDSERAENTVRKIIDEIVICDGLHRYAHDQYDGWMYRGFHRNKGAGYWPLLNFWLALVLNKMGRHEEALKYYNKVMNAIQDDCLIAEQIFENDIQKSVSPLCWSHVMFIFATHELGLLEF